MEEWCGNDGVDSLVRTYIGTINAAKIKERLPADKAPRRPGATAQVHGVRASFPRRIENHAEEWLSVVTVEIGAVRRPHHTMPKAVGDLKFHRNECLVMQR